MTIRNVSRVTVVYSDGETESYRDVPARKTVTEAKSDPLGSGTYEYVTLVLPKENRV